MSVYPSANNPSVDNPSVSDVGAAPVGNGSPTPPSATREHLKAAGEHLQEAARKAVNAIPSANDAAAQALKDGYAELAPDLAAARREAAEAGSSAAADAQQQWQSLLSTGESMLARSEQFVRERPVAAVGIAVASGFLLSRLLRR